MSGFGKLRTSGVRRAQGGFSLLELIIALLIFQVGLLAVAGMVMTAQEDLRRSALILRGTVEAVRMGDSLMEVGVEGEGEVETGWGWMKWAPSGSAEGDLRMWALAADGVDTLAALRVWPPPGFRYPLEGGETVPAGGAFPGGGAEWR